MKTCLEELVKLDEKIKFGDDLPDSSLRKLGEKYDSFFFFITDWPLGLKPFYIHEHEDNPCYRNLLIFNLDILTGVRGNKTA